MSENAPTPVPAWITTILRALRDETRGARLVAFDTNDAHSNEVFELRFDDGRALMLKRGRHAWAAEMFERSATASRLLRARSGIVAPAPLPLPDRAADRPVQAYWRIALPTLSQVWPQLNEAGRARALASFGALVRRLHGIHVPGWGPLGSTDSRAPTLAASLEADLAGRLQPAVAGQWPEALGLLESLVALAPAVARRTGSVTGSLVHGDLHMGNVLCTADGEEVRCVGLLDLDAAAVAPPESDLASFETLHGPLFEQTVDPRWFARFHEGYRGGADPFALGFFRAVHLANMGFYSALVGHDVHAAEVARALRTQLRALETSTLAGTEPLRIRGRRVTA